MDVLALFSQFGLHGLVIGALFISLWLLIREIKLLNESHEKRIDAVSENHSEERESWLKAYQDNTEVLRRIFEKAH